VIKVIKVNNDNSITPEALNKFADTLEKIATSLMKIEFGMLK